MVLTFKITVPLYTQVAFFYFENCYYCPHLTQHCVRLYINACCLTNQAFRLSTARAAKIYFLQHIARIQSTQVGIRPHADKLIMSVLHIRCIVPIVACFILRGKGRDLQFFVTGGGARGRQNGGLEPGLLCSVVGYGSAGRQNKRI